MKPVIIKIIALINILMLSLTLFGCATTKGNANSVDPYEPLNRKIFAFNRAVDKVFLRPVAVTYTTIVPRPLQRGIHNVFNNAYEIPNILNDILQGNIKQTFADAWRFVINSTVGLGGLFDVAKHVGLKKHKNDFGLTLAKWGVRQSPYFVMPIFGPSTARDTLGFAVDYATFPSTYIHPRSLRYSITGIQITDYRAQLLDTDQLIDQAFDPYIFVRNAYLQYRQALIRKMLNQEPDDLEEYSFENETQQALDQPLVAQPPAKEANSAQPLVATPAQ